MEAQLVWLMFIFLKNVTKHHEKTGYWMQTTKITVGCSCFLLHIFDAADFESDNNYKRKRSVESISVAHMQLK